MSKHTFKFSEKADKQMDEIMEIEGLKDRASVLNKALSLMHFVAKERKKGAKMFLENEKLNSRKEIVEF